MKESGTKVYRRDLHPLMSELTANLLSSLVVTHTLSCVKLRFARTTSRRGFPPRQSLITALGVVMT